MSYQIKYWDGSKSEKLVTKAEAIKEVCKGLHNWINNDDCIGQNDIATFFWVIGGDEGDTDACAYISQGE